jgi:hypothetical protein
MILKKIYKIIKWIFYIFSQKNPKQTTLNQYDMKNQIFLLD